MTIKDRGAKKWTSFFMPQHVDMIRDLHEEMERMKKPELDEQELEKLDIELQYAIHHDLQVELEYYHDYEVRRVTGLIRSIDYVTRKVWLNHGLVLSLDDILDARTL